MTRTKPNYGTGLLVLAVIVAFAWASDQDYRAEYGQSDELLAVQQEEQAKASRDWAARQVCGEAKEAQWLDDKTVQCVPRRGKTYRVAAQ